MNLDCSMAAIGQRILSQDNRATAHQLFLVQQRCRIYGMDTKYDGDAVWVHIDEWDECDAKLSAQLEAARDEDLHVPNQYRRVGYIDIWEFVTATFSEEAADLYIANNRHNLNDPRTYAATLCRNPEMIAVREALKDTSAALGGKEIE